MSVSKNRDKCDLGALLQRLPNFGSFSPKNQENLIETYATKNLHFDGPVVPDEQNMAATSFFKSYSIGLQRK